ncbi:hypothetical protein FAM21834_01995 [Lentilactobacillus parabuchneri]|nr:hypothetical protein FAM21834_01995 [Lentilactobacillus parabuchneri]ORN24219.1 hypothetical protein FAM23167_01982 [Lentilactobacillus parabuchneri]
MANPPIVGIGILFTRRLFGRSSAPTAKASFRINGVRTAEIIMVANSDTMISNFKTVTSLISFQININSIIQMTNHKNKVLLFHNLNKLTYLITPAQLCQFSHFTKLLAFSIVILHKNIYTRSCKTTALIIL